MTEPMDFTELTCTNLMIKLKILLNKLPQGDRVAFFATREQVDNTCSPFSGQGYQVSWDQEAENRYLVRLGK
ncbi:MAG: hypothetical protein A4E40_00871 [Methanoregulaceae archaeon PtaU1.Bin059]|nr:MAG: hypothetical protein A4E39_00432 [Methanoregulaceae archaeon PtaB.Bin152]OPY40292.1 MAG: hypothetical protein A4E40_00871 [Methanoregulaceae archaeon PtaU1.Bin059]